VPRATRAFDEFNHGSAVSDDRCQGIQSRRVAPV
jgi:hypothetical protein